LLRSNLKLKHLQFVVELGEQLHVGRVAEQMHVSQSTASKTLAEIESLVGERLFKRTSSGLVPTPQGEVFLGFAREMLGRTARLDEQLSAARLGFTGTVHVGAQIGAAMLVPLAVKLLKDQSPHTTVRLDDGLIEPLTDKLRIGASDLVVGRLDAIANTAGIVTESLYEDAVVIVTAPTSRIARKRAVKWSDLADRPWVLPPDESSARQRFNAAAADVGLPGPVDLVETSSFIALITLVHERDCMAVMSERVARFAEASSLLKVLPLPAIHIGSRVGIARMRGRELGASAELFLRCLREAAKRMRTDPLR
jgi:DNA-binding transcriptional LysR family regulator